MVDYYNDAGEKRWWHGPEWCSAGDEGGTTLDLCRERSQQGLLLYWVWVGAVKDDCKALV